MKKIYRFLFSAVTGMFFVTLSLAQAPQTLSYQAVVRDADNNLVTDTRVGMQISILQGSASGQTVYTETQTPTTNGNGLLTVVIGGQTGFDTIAWAEGPYFIQTGIDPAGGTDYTAITSTSQLLSVPYALHANTATGLKGKYYVGQLLGNNGEDGIVFWVDHTGEHGLICSYNDINDGNTATWNNGSDIETGAIKLYEGSGNTTTIVTAQGSGTYAAQLCADYSTAGTSAGDWYLPAIDELSKLYNMKFEVNKAVDDNVVKYSIYWSSTEVDGNSEYAWCYFFNTASTGTSTKSHTYKIRAVRAF